MKITFISNCLSHHQKPFCDELYNLIGSKFCFIATKPMSEERLMLGWNDYSESTQYVISAFKKNSNMKTKAILNDSDVIIIGAASTSWIIKPILKGQLVFRYTERPMKQGIKSLFKLKNIYSLLYSHILLQRKNYHLLAAGAYVSYDFKHLGCYKNRSWKWGYFTSKSNTIKNINFNESTLRILWVGRMLNLKKVITILDAILIAKENNLKVICKLIGDGEQKKYLKKFIQSHNLNDYVKLENIMTTDEIRLEMQNSHIYIFPSNYYEGWGAVLNEAMSEGCCVISSIGPGSAKYLIKNKSNGFLFPVDDHNSLFKIINELYFNRNLMKKISQNAINTIKKEWNPQVAAERFINLSNHLLLGKKSQLYKSGPCSVAEIINPKNEKI